MGCSLYLGIAGSVCSDGFDYSAEEVADIYEGQRLGAGNEDVVTISLGAQNRKSLRYDLRVMAQTFICYVIGNYRQEIFILAAASSTLSQASSTESAVASITPMRR